MSEQTLPNTGISPRCRELTQEMYDANYADGTGCPVLLRDKAVCPCRCHTDRYFDCTEDLVVTSALGESRTTP